MKNYGTQIVLIIITFVLTFILNFATSLFFIDNGTLEINNIKFVTGENVSQIRIENSSNENLNGIKLLIPSKTNISKITSTNTVKITSTNKDELTNANQKLIEISLIPARTITTLFIPINSNLETCIALNTKELKLDYKINSQAESPTLRAFYNGLQTTIIYTIFAAIILLWHKTKILELVNRVDDLNIVVKEDGLKIDKLKEKMTNAEKVLARKQAILIRRLSDHSKELSFWKDTIRKVLYDPSVNTSNADKIICAVTQQLGTYTTKIPASIEYETIEALAESLIEHDGTHIKNKLIHH